MYNTDVRCIIDISQEIMIEYSLKTGLLDLANMISQDSCIILKP